MPTLVWSSEVRPAAGSDHRTTLVTSHAKTVEVGTAVDGRDKDTGRCTAPNERPFGVSVIAVLVAIKGLASLAMALDLLTFDLAMQTHGDEPVAGVVFVTGLLLLNRAYGLLRMRYVPWLSTVVLLAVDGVTAVGELLLGTRTAAVWLSLFVAVGTELYLLRPSVRELFRKQHASQ